MTMEMDLNQAKHKFIEGCGNCSSLLGISRTMARIHGLLLVTDGSLAGEEIAAQLGISRGNASMNLNSLAAKGLIERQTRIGDRREFYHAEKDTWTIARQVALERQRRELEPLLRTLSELSQVQGDSGDAAFLCFRKMVASMEKSARSVHTILDIVASGKQRWFTSKIFKTGK